MNKTDKTAKTTENEKERKTQKNKGRKEIKFQEGLMEKAMKLSSDRVIAMAIRDMIRRDELN